MTLTGQTNGSVPNLLGSSLQQRWQKYLTVLRRCKRKCSEKSVHDLRVASRRLLATLDLIMTVMPSEAITGVTRDLKQRLNACGPLRDVQVQLLKVNGMRDVYPELNLFWTLLMLREQHALAAIHRMLLRVRTREMGQKIAACRKELLPMSDNLSMQTVALSALTGAAAGGFCRAVSRLQAIDTDVIESIHRLRVAFKKFRYTIEALQPVFPFVTGKLLKDMNEYQHRMGHIQDNVVLETALLQYARKRGKTAKTELSRVRKGLLLERKQLTETFLRSSNELSTFWEDSPQRPLSVPAV